mgnify:FL=1
MVGFRPVGWQPCQKLDGLRFRYRRMSTLDAHGEKPPVVYRKLNRTAGRRRRACYLRAMRYFIVSHNAALALLAHIWAVGTASGFGDIKQNSQST